MLHRTTSNSMQNKLLISGIILIGLLISPSYLYASSTCLPIFNGGKTCSTSKNISLLKEVKDPLTGKYVSSLSAQGPYYAAGQIISFRLTVENTSKSTIKNITITDIFPQYVAYVSGNGKFDMSKHSLVTTIDEIKASERRSYEVTGKIASNTELSRLAGQMNCFVNQVILSSRGNSVQTNTQYCVDKSQPQIIEPVQPTPTQQSTKKPITYAPQTIRKTPATGAGTLSLIGCIFLSVTGIYLRRFTKNKILSAE